MIVFGSVSTRGRALRRLLADTQNLQALGFQPNMTTLKIILPIGISFYTFQSMSYVIDVYRRHMPAERNFLKYAAFVSFWPQV